MKKMYFFLLSMALTMLLSSTSWAQCIFQTQLFDSNPVLSATNVNGAWYPDRYPPKSFVADGGRLKISIDGPADGAQVRPGGFSGGFYNTQGRKFNQCGTCVTVLKGDLYIPADWASKKRRTDMWATAFNSSNVITGYPIIGFRNVDGSTPGIFYYDINGAGAWVNSGVTISYNNWYTLEIRLSGSNLVYLVNNAVVGTVSSSSSAYFGDVIMQAYNFNDTALPVASQDLSPGSTTNSYDAFWDNLVITVPGVTNTNTGEQFCTIQAAIDDAQTLAGHTIEVSSGTYNEQVLVNKGVKILGVGATKPIVDFTGTVAGKATSFDVSADGVTIENINFKVDMSKLRSAIIASAAGIDNITVKDNLIEPYGTPAGTYGERNAVSVNYAAYRVATGGVNNVSFTGNTVTYNTGASSGFRAGIAVDEGGGTFSGNTIQTISQDIHVRFGSNGNISVTNNNINGGGVELVEQNAAAGTITITGNTFNGTFGNTYSSSLRLKNNFTFRPTTVSGNIFSNHQWGISLENYNTVTVDNNTFTPLAGSTTYRHLTVNTKEFSSSSGFYAPVVGLILTNNTFNGSGTTGGTGLGFYNNDNDSPTFGTFTLGTVGNENNFAAGIGTFIYLDDFVGTVAPNATNSVCWATNMDIPNNKFDVGAGLQLPSAMSPAQRTALEGKLEHKPDVACKGLLRFYFPVHNVTQNTYHTTIQAAIDAVTTVNGDVIAVPAGTYDEDVVVNKQLTINGAGIDVSYVVGPIGGGGATFQVAAAGVVINGFTITRAGNNTTDWNNSGLNSAGISIQSQGNTAEIKNNKIIGNRTGIDVNNSNGNNIQNNIITSNRTGLIFRNQTDNTTLIQNEITDNWTVGIVFLDASSGTNSPIQTAASSSFNNNKITGNWYGGIVDRQTGGSLPAPGANLKNFTCNWFGSTAPVVTTANSAEPGYAAQIPVAYGGSATPPPMTVAPDIAGPASANIAYIQFLTSGTDSDGSTIGFQPAPGNCVGCPGGGLVTNTNTGELFCSIQAAIDDPQTLAGHTITVAAGTYNENLLITKALTLTGAGRDLTFVNAVTPAPIAPAISNALATLHVDGNVSSPVLSGNVLIEGFTFADPLRLHSYVVHTDHIASGLQLTFRNNRVTNGNRYGWYDYHSHGSLLCENNIFSDVYYGMLLEGWDTGTLTIQNNEFTNLHYYINPPNTPVPGNGRPVGILAMTYIPDGVDCTNPYRIYENHFHTYAIEGSGIVFNGGLTGIGAAKYTDVEIARNTISPGAADGIGIRLRNLPAPNNDPNGGVHNALIHNNFISNAKYGIQLQGDNPGTQAHENSLVNILTRAIDNTGTAVMNATCNWYGTTDPMVVAGLVSANVSYQPFLNNGTDDAPTTGFQPVAGSCIGCNVGTVTIGTTSSICSGTGTNITFTGLPNAVITYNINGINPTTVTLNGTGTASVPTGPLTSNTTYNLVSANNGICSAPVSGSAVITTTVHSISLTSDAATESQITCLNAPITSITYAIGSGATGVNVTGLPTGITASVDGSILTISGSATITGTFNYSIVTTGNACPTATESGTIIVNPKPVVTLTVNGQTFNEGNNSVLCDTDANPVNTVTPNVTTSCIAGAVIWRTKIGAGDWSAWSTTAPSSQPSDNTAYQYQAACEGLCPATLTNPISLTINYRASTPQNVSLVADGITVAAGESKTVCDAAGNTIAFNGTCAAGEILLYSVDGGDYSTTVPSQIVDGNFHNYRVRCRKADNTPSCVETESAVMSLKISTAPAAPTVSITPTDGCGAPVAFSGTSSCGALATIWYNAATNQPLASLPATTPNATTSYYARCQNEAGCLSDNSNTVTYTVTPVNDAPVITVSSDMVCTGTQVTISANCPPGATAFWNTGVTENSFTVAFSNVTTQTYWAKCIFPNGCQSPESIHKSVLWKAFDLTFINIGQSQSGSKPANDKALWASQFITKDAGPVLENSTESNPTIYYSENVNKTAPRFWTIQVETCALGTDGSVTYDMLANPEVGVVRSYNTHENNAPYLMYANREGFTELYAQNHPAYGFYQDNGSGGNTYDAGLPKGLYKLSVRYWDQKGQGSIYPSTRQPAGNILAYQEYWFRIQSQSGVGAGAARESAMSISAENSFAEVMPNPVSNTLRLKVNDAKGQKVNTTLVDASGRQLLQRSFVPQTNQHQEEFEVSGLSNGMYFLKVNTTEKQTTLKVVKLQ